MIGRLFGRDRDDDDNVDPEMINAELRDGIEKELKRTDLSPEDRQNYENALANLNKQEQSPPET